MCHRAATISFSLVMSYPVEQRIGNNCFHSDNIHEGILMSAVSSSFIENIHFYYRNSNENNNNVNRIPKVEHIGSDGLLRLYYNEGKNFTVPGTLYDQQGLVNITIVSSSSQLANKILSLTWKQHTAININNLGKDCDVWSLDNVEVTVQYENCARSVLSEDFEDRK